MQNHALSDAQAIEVRRLFPISFNPCFVCVAYRKPKPDNNKSRPPSPQGNKSLCSTRSSSSSSKAIRRAGSVVPHRKVSTIDCTKAPCSAQSWTVTSARTGRLLFSSGEDDMREIASLTKITTCYIALLLAQDYGLSAHTLIPVSAKAAGVAGTTAELETGDRVRFGDLLYGLMLPSGNDAAQALAEYFGALIACKKGYVTMTKKLDRLFIREMNQLANSLSLRRTSYQNPHGLSIKKNFSTARDIGTLAVAAMRFPGFRELVNTRTHTCVISNKKQPDRTVTWENTNKLLLLPGFDGVKTGVTEAAGPCLCASVRKGEVRLVLTVLGARSMEERWVEVPRLAAWAFAHLESH